MTAAITLGGIRLLLRLFRFVFGVLRYGIRLYMLLKTCGASSAMDIVIEFLKTHALERASDLAAVIRRVITKVEEYLQYLFEITPRCGCQSASKAAGSRLANLVKQELALAA